jgi:hypothetical protein
MRCALTLIDPSAEAEMRLVSLTSSAHTVLPCPCHSRTHSHVVESHICSAINIELTPMMFVVACLEIPVMTARVHALRSTGERAHATVVRRDGAATLHTSHIKRRLARYCTNNPD